MQFRDWKWVTTLGETRQREDDVVSGRPRLTAMQSPVRTPSQSWIMARRCTRSRHAVSKQPQQPAREVWSAFRARQLRTECGPRPGCNTDPDFWLSSRVVEPEADRASSGYGNLGEGTHRPISRRQSSPPGEVIVTVRSIRV
jgi:hypothetical protein